MLQQGYVTCLAFPQRHWGTYRWVSVQIHREGLVTGGALGLALSPIHVLHHASSAEGVLTHGHHGVLQGVMAHPTDALQQNLCLLFLKLLLSFCSPWSRRRMHHKVWVVHSLQGVTTAKGPMTNIGFVSCGQLHLLLSCCSCLCVCAS